MTVIVGILADNGVVMASDSSATFSTPAVSTIGQQTVKKIHCIKDSIIFAATGAVGIGQQIQQHIEIKFSNNDLRANYPEEMMGKLSDEIRSKVEPHLRTAAYLQTIGRGGVDGSLCKTMISILVKNKPQLFTFDFNGAPEKATKELCFVSMGSGQPIADPFLAFLKRLLWKDKLPSLSEARLVAAWTIMHVCQTNPGGIGGEIQMAQLINPPAGQPAASVINENDIEEHLQKIVATEGALINEISNLSSSPVPTGP